MNLLELHQIMRKHLTVREDNSIAYYNGGEYCHYIPTIEDMVKLESDLNVAINDLLENGKAPLAIAPNYISSVTPKTELQADYSNSQVIVERTYTTLLSEIADIKYGTESDLGKGFLFTTDSAGNLHSSANSEILDLIREQLKNNSMHM